MVIKKLSGWIVEAEKVVETKSLQQHLDFA